MANNQQEKLKKKDKKKLKTSEISRRARRMGVRVMEISGGKSARTIAVGVGLMIVFWLLFSRVYVPLQQEAGLPPGVTERNPVLKSNEIDKLIEKYQERNDHVFKSYAPYRELFLVDPELL